jgi:hypothetical protein
MISIKNLLLSHKKAILVNTCVLLAFIILTILLLYAPSFDFLNQIPGDGGDGYQFLWDLWWVKHSTTELGTNPYFTNHLFYPDGHSLLFHSLIPLAGIITIPFQDSLGLFFSYNFVVILGYVLGGFGAYLLAKYYTDNTYISFLTGIVFTFSPFHLGHTLGHLNLISIGGIPFYILFLLKFRDTSNLRYAVFASVFLLISTFLGSFYYAFILFVFTIFFLLYDILLKRKIDFNRKFIYGLVLIPTIFLTVSGAITIPMVYTSLNGNNAYPEMTLDNQIDNSADIISFLTPASDNYFFGKAIKNIRYNFGLEFEGAENRVYIGYTIVGLFAFAFYRYKNKMLKHALWLLLTGTFAILSLGPILKIMGSTDLGIPLLGFLIRYLPGGTIFQSPSRFAVITYLGLGLLLAFSVKYILENVSTMRKHKVLPIILIAVISSLVIAEYNMSPYPSRYESYVPPIYHQLKGVDEEFSVLTLPAHNSLVGKYMYWSTASEKPLVDGYLSRVDSEKKQKLHDIPIVKFTDYLFEDYSDSSEFLLSLTNEGNTRDSFEELEKLDVRFIIIHKLFLDKTAVIKVTAYLIETVGAPFYADSDTIVFRL